MPVSWRIARIITRLNIGGPSIQAIGLSRDLRGVDFETLLIHGHLGEGEASITTMLPLDGVAAICLDSLTRAISPLRDLRASWQMFRALRRWRPAIVHTHMAKAGALGRLAAVAHSAARGASAMACWRPVVASPVGANLRIVESEVSGLLARPGEWGAALTRLYENPQLCATLGVNGRRTIERGYLLEVWAPRVAALWAQAAGRTTAVTLEVGDPRSCVE